MELKLDNFNVRKSKPIILGNAGLPKNTERYYLEGMKIKVTFLCFFLLQVISIYIVFF